MLYSHGWRSGLSPLVDVHWPVLSVCPQVTPLLYQQDLLHTDLQQLRSRLELMELMEPLQQQTLEQTAPFQTSVALRPLSYQLTTDGQRFSLNLDTGGFSPEELSVRQVGRKLRVSGKTEKKQEDATGCSSYRLQEFRQELDLPEGVKPETLTCYLGPDGKLHIQADKAPSVEETERELPINRSSEEKTQTEGGSSTDSHNSTQDATHTMD